MKDLRSDNNSPRYQDRQDRPPRRGPQRRGGQRSYSPRGRRPYSRGRQRKRLTFWQKLLKVLSFGILYRKPKKRAGVKRSFPKPDPKKIDSPRLYVGNLSYDAVEKDLQDLFNGVGEVQSAEVVTYRRTMRSKGYAFVQMAHIEEAQRAVGVLHDKEFMGRKLIVTAAKSPGARD